MNWIINFVVGGKNYYPQRDFTLTRDEKQSWVMPRSFVGECIATFMRKFPQIENVESGPLAEKEFFV